MICFCVVSVFVLEIFMTVSSQLSFSLSHSFLSSSFLVMSTSPSSDRRDSEANEASNASRVNEAGSDGANQAIHTARGAQGGRAAVPPLITQPNSRVGPIRKKYSSKVIDCDYTHLHSNTLFFILHLLISFRSSCSNHPLLSSGSWFVPL